MNISLFLNRGNDSLNKFNRSQKILVYTDQDYAHFLVGSYRILNPYS